MKKKEIKILCLLLCTLLMPIFKTPNIINELVCDNISVIETDSGEAYHFWNTTNDFDNYTNMISINNSNNNLRLDLENITFDFTDDINGAAPSGWYLYGSPSGIEVASEMAGRSKVVNITNNSAFKRMRRTYDKKKRINGDNLSFYLYMNDTNHMVNLYALTSGVPAFGIKIISQHFYGITSGGAINFGIHSINTWHFIEMIINYTSHTVDYYIDDVLKGDDETFYSNKDYINAIYFDFSCVQSYYIDTIKYRSSYYNGSWESKAIDLGESKKYDNIISRIENTSNNNVSIQWRDSEDNITWNGWSSKIFSNITLDISGQRYFQWKANFITNNISEIPILFWLNFSYSDLEAPILTGGEVDPISGYPSVTNFTYRVTYTDGNNDTPDIINVSIDGNMFAMVKEDPSDNDYTNGVIYNYTTTLPRAVHNYFFWCNSTDPIDSPYRLPSSGTYSGPSVNTIPTLSIGSVTPTIGIIGTEFIWRVTYTDGDNSAPTITYVYIDATQKTMTKQNPLDNDYTDGVIYRYAETIDVAGNYTYYFYFSDGLDTVRLPVAGSYENPEVTSPAVPPFEFDIWTLSIIIIIVLAGSVAAVLIYWTLTQTSRKVKIKLKM